MSSPTAEELAEMSRRNANHSAARPRSRTRAYAVTFDYLPETDRVEVSYTYPKTDGARTLVVSEDPLDGLEIHEEDPIDVGPTDVLLDLRRVRELLFPEGIGRIPATALDRLTDQLREITELI